MSPLCFIVFELKANSLKLKASYLHGKGLYTWTQHSSRYIKIHWITENLIDTTLGLTSFLFPDEATIIIVHRHNFGKPKLETFKILSQQIKAYSLKCQIRDKNTNNTYKHLRERKEVTSKNI